jgi:hypothetical protein
VRAFAASLPGPMHISSSDPAPAPEIFKAT